MHNEKYGFLFVSLCNGQLILTLTEFRQFYILHKFFSCSPRRQGDIILDKHHSQISCLMEVCFKKSQIFCNEFDINSVLQSEKHDVRKMILEVILNKEWMICFRKVYKNSCIDL